jgi:hypothetical protein
MRLIGWLLGGWRRKGAADPAGDRACPVCAGTGAVRRVLGYGRCEACNGSGIDLGVVMCDCETCQGRVPARPGAPSSAQIIARAYERLDACFRCNGSGRGYHGDGVFGKCFHCRGTGKNPYPRGTLAPSGQNDALPAEHDGALPRAGKPHPFLREPSTEESLGQAGATVCRGQLPEAPDGFRWTPVLGVPGQWFDDGAIEAQRLAAERDYQSPQSGDWFDEGAQEKMTQSGVSARWVQYKGMTLDLVDRTARTLSGLFAAQEMADRLFRDYDEDQAMRRAASLTPARDVYRMRSVEELLGG